MYKDVEFFKTLLGGLTPIEQENLRAALVYHKYDVPDQTDIDNLEGEIRELKDKISELEGEVSVLEDDLIRAGRRYTEAESELTKIGAILDERKGK